MRTFTAAFIVAMAIAAAPSDGNDLGHLEEALDAWHYTWSAPKVVDSEPIHKTSKTFKTFKTSKISSTPKTLQSLLSVKVGRTCAQCTSQCNRSCKKGGASANIVEKACSVTVYSLCNYRGASVTLPPGSFTLAALRRKGMKSSDIKSVNVKGNCQVRLFQQDRFKGRSLMKNGSDRCITKKVAQV